MRDMIEISNDFQTSVNIAYDLSNEAKVGGFIPTLSSLDIIGDVMLSVSPTSTQRARILIGAYGRGKSHIILVLLTLLYKKEKELFSVLLEKIKCSNPLLYEYVIEYLESDQKILPIIVRGSGTSLTQSFLGALHQALNSEGFSDLMPDTHFEAALNQIKIWEKDYPQTYERFALLISKSTPDFILALNEYDVSAYDEFVQIYPCLTSGSVFNPFFGFDIVDLYENITFKLKDKGYDGIFVVYDEFSKYLESSIATATNSDIKLLQDFAEKCDRSGSKQMHLMLISHKDIANYIDGSLPKDKVDGWRGVSGRFKHMNIYNNYSQMYEIITSVIQKKQNVWYSFKAMFQNRFDDLKERYTKNGLLNKYDQEEVDNVVEGCYPLHPISTYILPRLSEKVAQNERTLFTFLSSEDKFTLPAFLKQESSEFSLLTPDLIYDYFEPLFRKEPYTSDIHKMYKLTASVLHKIESQSLQSKIVKMISLIYLVEQFEKLPPVVDIIVDAYKDAVIDQREIHEALNSLIENECVVYLKRSNHYLKIKETSGDNINDEISKYIQKRLSNANIINILNSLNFDNYLYPTAYNDNHDIVRYFDFTFISSEDYWQTENWNQRIADSNADGVIFAIVPNNQNEIDLIRQNIRNETISLRRIIFILPIVFLDIQKDALDYAAVLALKNEARGDNFLVDEYDIYAEDLSEVVGKYIYDFMRPENGNAHYFYLGEQYNYRRKSQLSGLLSDICNRLFYRTPIINNESVNKNVISSVAINSRTKILRGLLANELLPNIGLTGTGQDVSIMRSTLVQTGVLINANINPVIELEPANDRMRVMISEIVTFFSEKSASKGGAQFKPLYDKLTLQDYGFGLKRGVIPIYIAAVINRYKNNLVVLYRGKEVKMTPELLNDINVSPHNYSVILEDWNEEKAQYMSQLENIFSEYTREHEKAFNSFTYILLAMNHWVLSLPKYAKEMVNMYEADGSSLKIDVAKRKFVNSLKQMDVNPREFLFEKVFSIFNMSGFNACIVENIAACKALYDSAIENLIFALAIRVKEIFAMRGVYGSLSSVIKDWYDSLSEKTRQTLFSSNENRILELMANVTNDESAFIQSLAKEVTFFRLEDWNSDTVDIFLRDLQAFKHIIEDSDTNKKEDDTGTTSYEIIFTDSKGNRVPMRFNKSTYSDRAKLLLNEMATQLDEYGQSISEKEKRQVLIELLEALC